MFGLTLAEKDDELTPTNSDADPVFSPLYEDYMHAQPSKFSHQNPARLGVERRYSSDESGDTTDGRNKREARLDIYHVTYEDMKKRSKLWKDAEREKTTTGTVDKRKAAALNVILG